MGERERLGGGIEGACKAGVKRDLHLPVPHMCSP